MRAYALTPNYAVFSRQHSRSSRNALGDSAKAEEWFQKALSIKPPHMRRAADSTRNGLAQHGRGGEAVAWSTEQALVPSAADVEVRHCASSFHAAAGDTTKMRLSWRGRLCSWIGPDALALEYSTGSPALQPGTLRGMGSSVGSDYANSGGRAQCRVAYRIARLQ